VLLRQEHRTQRTRAEQQGRQEPQQTDQTPRRGLDHIISVQSIRRGQIQHAHTRVNTKNGPAGGVLPVEPKKSVSRSDGVADGPFVPVATSDSCLIGANKHFDSSVRWLWFLTRVHRVQPHLLLLGLSLGRSSTALRSALQASFSEYICPDMREECPTRKLTSSSDADSSLGSSVADQRIP
jgi:hypothetical protein